MATERQRVLVVEDDPAFASLLTHLLDGDGYAVTATDSALGAVGLVRRLRPRVILLDLALPYRSGVSLLDKLKADRGTRDIPVVVVSGFTEWLTDERRATAAAVLAKPCAAGELLAAVRVA